MKQAYVSLVTFAPSGTDPDDYLAQLERVDQLLSTTARMHEIVIVARNPSPDFQQRWRAWSAAASVQGPVSLVNSRAAGTSYEEAMLEGLARCVGDFVLEWEAPLADLTPDAVAAMFAVSDEGHDVVQVAPTKPSPGNRAFYRIVNRYRTTSSPISSSVGALYSRAAVDTLIDARHAVRHRKVLLAQSGMSTAQAQSRAAGGSKGHPLSRLEEALDILLTGTRLGTRLMYWLALIAALGGLATAAYAIVSALVKGSAPEGWVTLMIVMGLSFAAVLITLALLGEMLSRILKEVQGGKTPGVKIEVLAPVSRGGPRAGTGEAPQQ